GSTRGPGSSSGPCDDGRTRPMPTTQPPTVTAAQAVTQVLADAGIRRCYTVPGESFLELTDAVEQHPDMTLISTRHENGAGFMAEADATLTRSEQRRGGQ